MDKHGYLSLSDIGYETVTGFKGVNCYHDWRPYYEGSTKTYTDKELQQMNNEKVTYNGKELSKYDAKQTQRNMERQIRQDKKDIAGLQGILTSNNTDNKLIEETKVNLINTQNKLKAHNSSLNDFIEQTNFRKDNSRLTIGKYVTNSNNGGIIEKQTLKRTIKSAATIKLKSKEEKIPSNIKDFYNYYNSKTNKILTPNNLNEVLGYNKLPTIVSKEEFNQLAINNKYGILERGFKTGKGTLGIDKIIDNYKHGDFYVGEGIYGSGTYTAYGNNAHKIALSYASNNEQFSCENNVVKYLLKDDAKVIKYSDLRKMRDEELNQLIKENGFKDYFDVIENGFKSINTTEISKYIMEMQDAGVYASIKGYDAIDTFTDNVWGDENSYLVILNRKKMIMYD